MKNMIENLINGNLSYAKHQAKRVGKANIYMYLVNKLFWDKAKALTAANYLKNPSQQTFNEWCKYSIN